MKKIFALLLALCMILALAACGQKPAEAPAETTPAPTEAPAETAAPAEPAAEETPAPEETAAPQEPAVDEPAVMSYAEYAAAAIDDPVVVECYVQAHQSWWADKISVYAQDEDGAYFLYDMACSADDAEKLVPGQKIRVTGYKGEWAGEVEIVDASFEFVEGESFIAEPIDLGALLGTEELDAHINQFFSLTGATVADKGDGAAFFFNWDNSGEDGNCDLYFDVEVNGATYTFVVRRYLTAPGGEVYEAVKNLHVGDIVDIEGFLYWYEGPQPHISSIAVVG